MLSYLLITLKKGNIKILSKYLIEGATNYRIMLNFTYLTLDKKIWLSVILYIFPCTKYWSYEKLYLDTEWFVWWDIFTVLCSLLRLLCPMVVSFEDIPLCLQFSSGNFGETYVANWEMFHFAFCKPDPSRSMIINLLGFLKKTNSVRQMLSVRWSKSQNRIVPGFRGRLVAGENCWKTWRVKSDDCTWKYGSEFASNWNISKTACRLTVCFQGRHSWHTSCNSTIVRLCIKVNTIYQVWPFTTQPVGHDITVTPVWNLIM